MRLILIADGSRARFFEFERADAHDEEPTQEFRELEDMVNPEQELRGQEMFDNVKSGRNRVAMSGPAHGYDDHREQNRRQASRNFAKRVAERTAELLTNGRSRLIVMADPRTLGLLREQLRSANVTVPTEELPRDMSAASAHELRNYLAGAGLVPPRRDTRPPPR